MSQKVDSDTLCAFQMNQKTIKIPTLSDFLDYLKEKAFALKVNTKTEVKLQRQ